MLLDKCCSESKSSEPSSKLFMSFCSSCISSGEQTCDSGTGIFPIDLRDFVNGWRNVNVLLGNRVVLP